MLNDVANITNFTAYSVSFIGTISYGIAAVIFALAAIFLWLGWHPKRTRGTDAPSNFISSKNPLWVACLISSLWSASALLLSLYPLRHLYFLVQFLELFRDCAWLFILARIIGYSPSIKNDDQYASQQHRKLTLYAIVIAFILLIITLTQPFLPVDSAILAIDQFLIPIGLMVLSIFGVIFAEQIIRNTPPSERWNVKFFCLSIGIVFTYDFFMYSHAVLFKTIQIELWQARGIVNAALIPLLLIGAARGSARPLEISISRRFVFRTGTLFAASIYLIGISLAGYYFKQVGGTWGELLQTLFLVLGAIALLFLLFSGGVRARFSVWLSKNFFSYRYDYREEWIRFNTLLTDIDSGHDMGARALTAMANIVESVGGIIWYQSRPGFYEPIYYRSITHPEDLERKLPTSLIEFWAKSDWVINLEEYHDTPSRYESLTLPAWLEHHKEFWLLIPLQMNHQQVGAIALCKPRIPLQLNWENYDLLKIAARQVCSFLAEEQATKALSQSKQFEAVNQATAFLVHDIKTMVSQLSLLVKNAEKHKANPAFIEDMIKTIDHTAKKMSRLLSQLKEKQNPDSLLRQSEQASPLHSQPLQDNSLQNSSFQNNPLQYNRGNNNGNEPASEETLKQCKLMPLLEKLIEQHQISEPKPTLRLHSELPDHLMIHIDPEALYTALNHIVQNAKESTPTNGSITVDIILLPGEQENGHQELQIAVRDTGSGMSETFIREQLFLPFASTKGLSGMGIGAYQSRELIRAHGGDLRVESQLERGTIFTLHLNCSHSDN